MGLKFKRYFTRNQNPGKNVFDEFNYQKEDIDILDENNQVSFVQKDVEFPEEWGNLDRKITASRYFYGENGTPERENSVRGLIERVSNTFGDWAERQNYFESSEEKQAFVDEIAYLSLDQRSAFNSPVWFNVGIHKIEKNKGSDQRTAYIIDNEGRVQLMPIGREREYPQTSACFIQGVGDTMEEIMQLAVNEAMLFKYGSGTGTNLSTLRSSKEKLSGGGKPSGPLAYWAFYDKVAGIVKSGGKTRRAAKMDILNVTHPDIIEFINSKRREEEKMKILIENGIDQKEARDTVAYQNTNISVRTNDLFMRAAENNEEFKTIPVHNKELADEMPIYNAKEVLRKISENTHACGDPGMQYHDTINLWHTCPNSSEISGSNPCSEYMFVDDSSCNLASLNLVKFLNEDGTFDTEAYQKTIKTVAIAQDLEFDNSSFPTKKIAENSHKFRPLGMGYANLGSLLMLKGLPYDSDEGRAIAASLTALMTGKVYETSAEMARDIGQFEEYKLNKEPMMKVMNMHKNALKKIKREHIPKGLENILEEAEKVWENVIDKGERYGFRNAQATVLAPTGTIGFMMGCDTKGIEPEIGLIQVKKLEEGGTLRLVNNTVPIALKNLGYSVEEISSITAYINENETIEGAPELKEEHQAVFDCANKPQNGTRTISPEGHLKMMAAVQPFISGAISKTVNLPSDATVENIEKIYMDAWKMGLKAVALYRDGSKNFQVMNFSKKDKNVVLPKPIRRKLPITAPSIRHKFNLMGHEGYLHIGLYEDGNPGELFISMNKEGSTMGGLMDSYATSMSLNLQYGVPLESLVKKFKKQRFEPAGMIWEGHPEIKGAVSIVDYIAQFLEKEFLSGKSKNEEDLEEVIVNGENKEVLESEEKIETLGESGSFCPECGVSMNKINRCDEKCPECGLINYGTCGGA